MTIDDLWRITDHAPGDDPECLRIVHTVNAFRELKRRLEDLEDRLQTQDSAIIEKDAEIHRLNTVSIQGYEWAGDPQYAPWNTAREKLARWMIKEGFATGHGDTFEDLLQELSQQIAELREAAQ